MPVNLDGEVVTAFTLLAPKPCSGDEDLTINSGAGDEIGARRFGFSVPVNFREDNSRDPFLPVNGPVSSSPGTTGSSLLQCKRGSCVRWVLVIMSECVTTGSRRRECRLAACVDFFFFFSA